MNGPLRAGLWAGCAGLVGGAMYLGAAFVFGWSVSQWHGVAAGFVSAISFDIARLLTRKDGAA